MCRSKTKSNDPTPSQSSIDCEGGALCTVTASDANSNKPISSEHHLYDMLSDTWIKKRFQPQLYINLNVKVLQEDYGALGYKLTAMPQTSLIPAMADTGCQSCLAGVKVSHRHGLQQSDLITVTMKMHAANQNGIKIIGATVLRLSGRDSSGRLVETRQMIYVTDESDRLFLVGKHVLILASFQTTFP